MNLLLKLFLMSCLHGKLNMTQAVALYPTSDRSAVNLASFYTGRQSKGPDNYKALKFAVTSISLAARLAGGRSGSQSHRARQGAGLTTVVRRSDVLGHGTRPSSQPQRSLNEPCPENCGYQSQGSPGTPHLLTFHPAKFFSLLSSHEHVEMGEASRLIKTLRLGQCDL